jgi:hydroxypyruvate isomerase
MAQIHQAVCYPILGEGVDRPGLFAAIKRIGFEGVEMWGAGNDFADVCRLAADTGLKMVSMTADGWGWNEPAKRAANQDELRRSIERAAGVGIGNLIVLAGNRNPGIDDDQAIDIVAEGLMGVVGEAEAAKVNLNLELLNSKIDHIGFQCDHTHWGLAVIKKVNSRRVKLLYDVYHMQIMEGDLIRTIRNTIGWIGHFHIAGNPGRGDLDGQQEINYRAVCETISELDYDGFIGHEFKPAGDPIKALERAFDICAVA